MLFPFEMTFLFRDCQECFHYLPQGPELEYVDQCDRFCSLVENLEI